MSFKREALTKLCRVQGPAKSRPKSWFIKFGTIFISNFSSVSLLLLRFFIFLIFPPQFFLIVLLRVSCLHTRESPGYASAVQGGSHDIIPRNELSVKASVTVGLRVWGLGTKFCKGSLDCNSYAAVCCKFVSSMQYPVLLMVS